MIQNLIFDVGDVLVEYRWFEMLTKDYGLSEAEAKRIGGEMFDNEIWGLWLQRVHLIGNHTAIQHIQEFRSLSMHVEQFF